MESLATSPRAWAIALGLLALVQVGCDDPTPPPTVDTQSPYEATGFLDYGTAVGSHPVSQLSNESMWLELVDACKELGVEGELIWAGEAGKNAFWVCTVTEVFDNGNEAGKRALITKSDGEWKWVKGSSWIN